MAAVGNVVLCPKVRFSVGGIRFPSGKEVATAFFVFTTSFAFTCAPLLFICSLS
jgi:hypothetical protein